MPVAGTSTRAGSPFTRGLSRATDAALVTLALHGLLLLACAFAKEPPPEPAVVTTATDRGYVLPPLAPDPDAYIPEPDDVLGGADPSQSCARSMTMHFVRPGETLASIAKDQGLDSFRQLYDRQLNPELVALRPDPAHVEVGDVLRLPPPAGQHFCPGQMAALHEVHWF